MSVTLSDYQDTDIEKSFSEYHDDLLKGFRQGLVKKRITDKTGKVTTVWVRPEGDVKTKFNRKKQSGVIKLRKFTDKDWRNWSGTEDDPKAKPLIADNFTVDGVPATVIIDKYGMGIVAIDPKTADNTFSSDYETSYNKAKDVINTMTTTDLKSKDLKAAGFETLKTY